MSALERFAPSWWADLSSFGRPPIALRADDWWTQLATLTVADPDCQRRGLPSRANRLDEFASPDRERDSMFAPEILLTVNWHAKDLPLERLAIELGGSTGRHPLPWARTTCGRRRSSGWGAAASSCRSVPAGPREGRDDDPFAVDVEANVGGNLLHGWLLRMRLWPRWCSHTPKLIRAPAQRASRFILSELRSPVCRLARKEVGEAAGRLELPVTSTRG